MQTELLKIFCKPTDYKVCSKCSTINWYENEFCVSYSCVSKEFNSQTHDVGKAIEKEYEFWKNEGYSEESIDSIFYDI